MRSEYVAGSIQGLCAWQAKGVPRHTGGVMSRAQHLVSLRLMIRTTHHDSTTITMWFQDAGRGLAAVTLKDMFHACCSTKANGMGIGLASSRAIVAAHGGRI
jgi:C4-dicarboxylate-specific signal transduction histidine kinase